MSSTYNIFTSLIHMLTLVFSKTCEAHFLMPKIAERKPRQPPWATLSMSALASSLNLRH